jgi:hypothetical protein
LEKYRQVFQELGPFNFRNQGVFNPQALPSAGLLPCFGMLPYI